MTPHLSAAWVLSTHTRRWLRGDSMPPAAIMAELSQERNAMQVCWKTVKCTEQYNANLSEALTNWKTKHEGCCGVNGWIPVTEYVSWQVWCCVCVGESSQVCVCLCATRGQRGSVCWIKSIRFFFPVCISSRQWAWENQKSSEPLALSGKYPSQHSRTPKVTFSSQKKKSLAFEFTEEDMVNTPQWRVIQSFQVALVDTSRGHVFEKRHIQTHSSTSESLPCYPSDNME